LKEIEIKNEYYWRLNGKVTKKQHGKNLLDLQRMHLKVYKITGSISIKRFKKVCRKFKSNKNCKIIILTVIIIKII
jgi:hypothetical protein